MTEKRPSSGVTDLISASLTLKVFDKIVESSGFQTGFAHEARGGDMAFFPAGVIFRPVVREGNTGPPELDVFIFGGGYALALPFLYKNGSL